MAVPTGLAVGAAGVVGDPFAGGGEGSTVGGTDRFDVAAGWVVAVASGVGKSAAVQEVNAAISQANDRYRRRFIYSVGAGSKPGVTGVWAEIDSFVLSRSIKPVHGRLDVYFEEAIDSLDHPHLGFSHDGRLFL